MIIDYDHDHHNHDQTNQNWHQKSQIIEFYQSHQKKLSDLVCRPQFEGRSTGLQKPNHLCGFIFHDMVSFFLVLMDTILLMKKKVKMKSENIQKWKFWSAIRYGHLAGIKGRNGYWGKIHPVLLKAGQPEWNDLEKDGNMVVRVRIKDDEDVSKNFWIRTSNLASGSDWQWGKRNLWPSSSPDVLQQLCGLSWHSSHLAMISCSLLNNIG